MECCIRFSKNFIINWKNIVQKCPLFNIGLQYAVRGLCSAILYECTEQMFYLRIVDGYISLKWWKGPRNGESNIS